MKRVGLIVLLIGACLATAVLGIRSRGLRFGRAPDQSSGGVAKPVSSGASAAAVSAAPSSASAASASVASTSPKKLEPQYVGSNTACQGDCHAQPEYKNEEPEPVACRDDDLGCPVRSEAVGRQGPTIASSCGCSPCPCSNNGPLPAHTTTEDVKTRLPVIPAYNGEDGVESDSSSESAASESSGEAATEASSESSSTPGKDSGDLKDSIKEMAKKIAEEGLLDAAKDVGGSN